MATPKPDQPTDVEIRDDMIRLGQFLKLTGIADDGATARALLSDEAIDVNGEAESRRGRQLHPGDLVEVDLPDGVRRLRVVRPV
ncbi:RNA-binding S4 domain-containing protein [Occultella glacieicola]|uniref:RNA-binding S4 domain-containing protein n=1 Tax=Occultella glacieicola TaxID=2518684 RepID=A0ABY2E1B6_9MICO|nr:RNA-binding S4 domain-containing protein [Occultella glacieicola]TDE90838.1 RNA-binding S4 domain-containing protein [Occultella glacieicola]